MREIVVRLTSKQADAVLFACSNALSEPTNFEHGSGYERTAASLRRAQRKIASAVLHSIILKQPLSNET